MATESEMDDDGTPRLNSLEFPCLKPGQGCHMEAIRNEAWRGQPNKDEPSTVLSFFEEGHVVEGGIDVSESKPSSWLRAARFMGWYGRLSVL
jgi:hypothetical protein